ncbi:MAG: SLBB domain-containing protein [Candidatus Paceibacterota bacterium]
MWPLRSFLCSLLMLSAAGCAQSQHYSASRLPAEFQPAPNVSVHHLDLSGLAGSSSPTDVLEVGDTVSLSIVTGLEEKESPEWELRIGDDGMLPVPLVGPTRVAGLRVSDAERLIGEASVQRGVYVTPNVTLAIAKRRTNTVSVVGAVKMPGSYQLPATSSHLMSAINLAQGLADDASTVIEIRHPPGTGERLARMQAIQPAGYAGAESAPVIPDNYELNLESIEQIDKARVELYDRTVVVVHRRPERNVRVLGLVRTPTSVTMPEEQEFRLLDAITAAGGVSQPMADKVHVIRQSPAAGQVIIEASISEAKKSGAGNLRLGSGDVVSVESTPLTVAADAVRSFFRVGFSAALPGF